MELTFFVPVSAVQCTRVRWHLKKHPKQTKQKKPQTKSGGAQPANLIFCDCLSFWGQIKCGKV